jgi:hypothetical protein
VERVQHLRQLTDTHIVVGTEEQVLAWQNDIVTCAADLARKYGLALLGGSTEIKDYGEAEEAQN